MLIKINFDCSNKTQTLT